MRYISNATPLFMLSIKDPQEPGYYFLVFRVQESPHTYDWHTLLTEWDGREMSHQHYTQDVLSRQCFTDDEASVIEAHARGLGYRSERTPVGLPMGDCISSDCCGNVWQYRDFWEEGAVPCVLPYVGYFGVETELVPGLLPYNYFDKSIILHEDGGVEVQPSLWERESQD